MVTSAPQRKRYVRYGGADLEKSPEARPRLNRRSVVSGAPSRIRLPTRFEEGLAGLARPDVPFRMPLHAEDRAAAGWRDRFDQPVRRMGLAARPSPSRSMPWRWTEMTLSRRAA